MCLVAGRSWEWSRGACGIAATSAPPPQVNSSDQFSSGAVITWHVHLRRSAGHGVALPVTVTCHPTNLERSVGCVVVLSSALTRQCLAHTPGGECVPVSRWSGMTITCPVYLERLLDRCSTKLYMTDT